MSVYITEGLERARDGLSEAAALRERFVLGTSVSRRVAAAAASAVIPSLFSFSLFEIYYWVELFITFFIISQAEAAAAAGESSFKSFMVAVQRCGSSVAIVQQACWITFMVISAFQFFSYEKASATTIEIYKHFDPIFYYGNSIF